MIKSFFVAARETGTKKEQNPVPSPGTCREPKKQGRRHDACGPGVRPVTLRYAARSLPQAVEKPLNQNPQETANSPARLRQEEA